MESDAENAKEIETYSFLLGSALRNEDSDQFLSIYDSILPKDLAEKQIETIKKKSRDIADLPEDNFSKLVSKARSFSLAQDRGKMSHRDEKSRHFTDRHAYYQDDDSDEHCPASESSYFRVNSDCIIDIPSFPEEEKRTDNDSGIYNSSKATTSLCSNSDQEESEGEERAASFDYFPCTTTKITPMYHNEYDEAYDVDSEKGSQIDIESPRSDKSGNKDSDQDYYHGTEMTTFRTFSREQDDFETDDDSDDEVKFAAPHRKLYNERRSCNYYTPMTQESCEEYGDICSSTFSFEKSRKALKDQSTSSLRGVDDSIHFPLSSPTPSRYSNYSRYNNNSSDGVRVEKSMYSRHDNMFSGAKDPPFGHGKDQVDKVGKSICTLLTNNSSLVDDMPEGRRIAQSLDLADDIKKKRKKKRGSKDDLDDKARRNSDYDENGNPIDRYLQMRGSPKLSSGSSVIRKNYPGAASSAFPSHFKDFSPYSLGTTPISELETPSFHQSLENRTEKKPRKKLKKEKVSYSQEIENYVGNKEIDELLDFIESDKNGRKQKKNSQTISNDVTVLSKSTEKNNKKNKDRKLNKSAVDEKCEISEKEEIKEPKVIDENTPLINSQKTEYTDYKTQSIENHNVEKVCAITEPHLKNSINRMGNTTGKQLSDENTESNVQIIEEKVQEKEEEWQPSLPLENETIEITKEETNPSENLTNETEKHIKKDKKAVTKAADKHNQSNKQVAKAKGGNPKSENNIMNCVDSALQENNSLKPKQQSGNGRHKNSERAARKDLLTNDHALNGLVNNNNKDKTSLLILNELDLVHGDDYRFTDFEPIKREPEFTVVGKKKKKPTAVKEPASVKDMSVPTKSVKREEKRKAPRSVTPPPLNKLSSNFEDDRTRDLSPSAFPALGSSNQSSFRDARRNSTGDVRMEVQNIIKAQDDSDIESVKSLPASSQGVWGQNSLSPCLPVSYAKMAASPKPSVTSLGSSTTEEDPGETNMDFKAANWKGHLKERRHSIGSHPENVKEIECASTKQKYGSQEVLNICEQDILLIDSDFPKVGFANELKHESNSDNNEKSNTSLCSNVSVVENNSNDTNSINSQLTSSDSKSFKNSNSAKQSNEEGDGCFHEMDKSTESCYKVSNSRKGIEMNNVEKMKSTKQHTLNNSKKVKQSVIFMDKRVSQPPKNLGISFFFDSENESSGTDADLENLQKCSLNSSNNIPKTSDSKYLRSSDNASVIDYNSVNNNQQGTEFISKCHSLAGKNGVVEHIVNPYFQNKNHPHNDDAIIFISEQNQFIDAAPISNDLKLSNNSKQQSPVSQRSVNPDNLVLVMIGDRINVEPNSLPKDKCKQQLFYRHDSGDVNSNQRFNFPEAVGYLNKEWERALEGSRKNPKEVVVYES